MEQFPHLKFVKKISGKPYYPSFPRENVRANENRKNRKEHSKSLFQSTSKIKTDWHNSIQNRKSEELAEINEEITPVFLQINPDKITAEFNLESFGIEIISEEDEGFIIGASFDNLRSLEEKIKGFVAEKRGSGMIAEFWQIIEGNNDVWRPQHILTEELFAKWAEIKDDEQFNVEVSIAFAKPLKKKPNSVYQNSKAQKRYRKYLEDRDNLLFNRQDSFDEFISFYGKRTSDFVNLSDSFCCEVTISGKGLKDLVVNYQYVFEVSEIDEVTSIEGQTKEIPEIEIEVFPPDDNATIIGVIDSGIMENHKYISPAIIESSKSYIEDDHSTADYVKGGGHGTKVAGAILYPKGITQVELSYKLPCFIKNLRVLDKDGILRHKYPASLMETIVNENEECKIFNLSISSKLACRIKHMSSWATIIDKLIFEKDILFIISSGNLSKSIIRDYIKSGKDYPDYLAESYCRLANPSQSSFGLSVGSINSINFEDENWKSLGAENDISAFSRIGTGIWDSIKPDVVEYGGGLVISKNGDTLIKENVATSPELVRSTLHGGSALGKDSIGTSFSTPKVTHISAVLKQIYPDEGVNLLRAFIAQGARLPKNYFYNPTKTSIQYFGYGLPLLERVTKNSDYRITFYNTGNIKAEEGHLYSLKIPESMRGQGDEFDILIEVTLSYSAQVRRTRQRTKSYLSTWLDWTSSKLNESFKKFASRSLTFEEDDSQSEDLEDVSGQVIQWKIRERSNWGNVKELNRNNSSLQKDWAIIKSFELPEELSFAVRGHKGWDQNKMAIPYAIAVSIEILSADIPIYEELRIENEVNIEIEI